MKSKGFTLVELLATMVIIAIVITIAVSGFNGISSRIKKSSYENKVSYIENAAANYGDATGESVVFVDTLVKEGYIEADNEDGNVYDPRDDSIMNCYVVNIIFENDNVYGKYTNEEMITIDEKTCDKDKLKTKYLVVDLKLYEATNDTGTSWETISLEKDVWTNKNVVLIAEIDDEMKDKVNKISFISNAESEEREVNNDYDSKNKKYISANQLMNTRYTVKVETKEKDSEGNVITNEYTSQIKVKIDKQRPIIYDSEVEIEGGNAWTNSSKKIKVVASDGAGSGIYGFSISENNNCNNVSYTPSSGNDDTYEIGFNKNGEYYICAKDNAGNVSEDESTKKIVINTIDTTPPECVWSGENTTWTKNSVTITLEGKDNESGSSSIYTKTFTEGEISKTKLSYFIYDNAGNKTLCERDVNVYIDTIAPTCNWNGENNTWKNNSVVVTVNGIDKGSGSTSFNQWSYVSGTVSTKSLSYTIKDNLGNNRICTKNVPIYVDKDIPNVNFNLNSGTYKTAQNVTITAADVNNGSNIKLMQYEVYHNNVLIDYNYNYQSTSKTVSLNTQGTYNIYFKALDNAGNWSNNGNWTSREYTINLCEYTPGKVFEFNYTGSPQSIKVCSGTYKLEVYGAQGGTYSYNNLTYAGGYGGYAIGQITLDSSQVPFLYVVVGGSGVAPIYNSVSNGGYNGGGMSSNVSEQSFYGASASGGGATHIATTNRGVLANYSSYKNEVLIVAGGGGGSGIGRGGSGGGTNGSAGDTYDAEDPQILEKPGKGGTQTSGGATWYKTTGYWPEYAHGSFGTGGYVIARGGGGGGGWYGGGGGGEYNGGRPGGGGSGYIGGVTGGSMQSGVRSGNGYAKVTYLG